MSYHRVLANHRAALAFRDSGYVTTGSPRETVVEKGELPQLVGCEFYDRWTVQIEFDDRYEQAGWPGVGYYTPSFSCRSERTARRYAKMWDDRVGGESHRTRRKIGSSPWLTMSKVVFIPGDLSI